MPAAAGKGSDACGVVIDEAANPPLDFVGSHHAQGHHLVGARRPREVDELDQHGGELAGSPVWSAGIRSLMHWIGRIPAIATSCSDCSELGRRWARLLIVRVPRRGRWRPRSQRMVDQGLAAESPSQLIATARGGGPVHWRPGGDLHLICLLPWAACHSLRSSPQTAPAARFLSCTWPLGRAGTEARAPRTQWLLLDG
jgi:hypothetical protein